MLVYLTERDTIDTQQKLCMVAEQLFVNEIEV
jgi:hypothetical protein